MLRQLNLLPLLVIPIATIAFIARAGIVPVSWLTPSERAVGPPIVEQFSMASAQTGKDYDIQVQLPADYAASDVVYPVIYAINGKPNLLSWKDVIAPLLRRSSIPDVIVVGISPARRREGRRARGLFSPAQEHSRWADDTTRTSNKPRHDAPIGGKADAFTAFLETDVFPRIETEFRADKGDRCLAGFDLAALFAVETALLRPELFQRYLVIAPVTRWGERAAIRLAVERVKTDYDPAIRMFLCMGSVDDSASLKSFANLSEVLASKQYMNLKLKSKVLPNLQHANVTAPGAREGLRFLYGKR